MTVIIRDEGEGMKLETIHLPYANPLARAYLEDFSRVAHLFEYNPGDGEAFDRRCLYLDETYGNRQQVVEILTRYNEELGCSAAIRANLAALAQPGAAAVITGQQAGVITGPLYTIYKALTAVQLAQRLSSELERPVVPIFWVAAEDHDFQEINHIHILGSDNRVVKLQLEQESPGRVAAGHLPVIPAVEQLLAALEALTNQNEWQQEILQTLRELARQSTNLAQWFARVMQWLFREQGLIIADPLEPGLKELAVGFFRQAVEETAEVDAALEQGRQAVLELGYTPQVEAQPGHTNLFFYQEGELPQRRPLFYDGQGFHTREGDSRWSREELLALAADNPAALSPNVVLRPLVQDVLFPTVAYVAGPGEVSYYALYKEVYRVMGRRMPVIYPRANVTLIEPGIARHLEKYQLCGDKVFNGLEDRLQELLKEADQLGIEGLFAQVKDDFSPKYSRLIEELGGLDPALVKLGQENLERILGQMDFLQGKAMQKHRQTQEGMVKHFQKIKTALFPNNSWQEREYNLIPFLFKYGPDLVTRLGELPLSHGREHNVIFV
ncbi:MAG: bacillithiol biosynthesis cysteine-adding enzyme BshC [Clostridia bacterium]|nr:bacillithiol biosynthesis cysteine-adding enzyme BshC [Clostridia bacterium]